MDKNIQSFFRLAKSVSLKREEREKMREEILESVVRNEGTERQGSAVDLDLKPFIAAAQSLRLRESEKREAWERLEAYVALRPVRQGIEAIEEIGGIEEREDRRLGFPGIFSLKMLSSAVIALFIVAITGGGLTYAAEGTLPGDVLYPFKVYVAENVIERFHLSPEAKAWWEARLAERRLTELEELAAHTRLRAEVSAELAEQFARRSRRVRDRILQLTARGEVERAAELTLAFESSLQAHQAVLAQLTATPAMSSSVEHAKKRVEGQMAEVNRSRERVAAEADVRGEVLAAVTQSASRRAERELKAVRAFMGRVEHLVSEEERRALVATIDAAEQTLENALQREGATELSEAYESVQTVLVDAKHLKQLLELRQRGGSIQITVVSEQKYKEISVQPAAVLFRVATPIERALEASPRGSMESVTETESTEKNDDSDSVQQEIEVRSEVRSNVDIQLRSGQGSVESVRESNQELKERIERKTEELREKILDRVGEKVEGLQGELLERRAAPVRWVSETMPLR